MSSKIIYVLAMLALLFLAIWLEYGREFSESGGCTGSEQSSGELAPVGYRLMMSLIQKSQVSADTKVKDNPKVYVVSLTPGDEPQTLFADNVCTQRPFLAKLIEKLENDGAILLVVDKYFSAASCPEDFQGTTLYKAAAQARVPLVLGLKFGPPSNTAEDICLSLSPDSLFDPLKYPDLSSHLAFGAVTLNVDTRKIPLEWPIVPAADGPTKFNFTSFANTSPTLSLVAAELARSDLKNDKKLQDLILERAHPFGTFISDEEMNTRIISASEVLCGAKGATRDDGTCLPDKVPDPVSLRKAAQKTANFAKNVVIIGEFTSRDMHPSVMKAGDVPGVVLQANYIEALINDSYFTPASVVASVGFFSLWIAVLYIFFWRMSPTKAVRYSILAFAVLMVVAFVLARFCRYFVPTSIELSAGATIALKWVECRGHLLWSHGDHH